MGRDMFMKKYNMAWDEVQDLVRAPGRVPAEEFEKAQESVGVSAEEGLVEDENNIFV
jgi:hypothetical protein